MSPLDRLLAIEELRQLEARYARLADKHDWTALANLFTPEGILAPLDEFGTEIFRASGRLEIAATLGARNGKDVRTVHQLFSSEIDISSTNAANGVWAMADLVFRDGPPPRPFRTMRGWGHYHVAYSRLDGEWLIASKTQTRLHREFTH
ncbi:nuclear transport factor 2 family protein [Rhodococcus sp. NCIMB 12038]|uniref:nuclear transport factor 2 family protein n=1 Tax=Rhodococcus sp. NCIMB 12038 TaxID=933800 RepID=UPI0015C5F31B|nr:nuclear transport factor 2 family protein [Rhodococcus sp. NCIMB 12038]